MAISIRSSQAATLTGGDLSVDILHTEDSVRLGDGTDLMSFQDVGGVKTIPVKVLSTTGATDATLTGGSQRSKITDGTDNVEIDDVGGEKALKVSVIASVGGGGGGTAATDSAAYTATSSQFTPIGGAYDDTSSDALAEGEMGMCRVTSGRALHVAVQNSVAVTGTFWQATQPISAASLPLPTGAATSANQDTANTALSAIKTAVELLDNTVSGSELQVDIVSMPNVTIGNASLAVTGTFWQATQPVSIAAAVAVTDNGSTLSVDDGGASLTVDGTVGISGSVAVTGTFWQATQPVSIAANVGVVGAAAHDAAASGNPVMIAGRAKNALPTSVADGDASYIMTDLGGRPVVTLSPRDLVVQATGSQATTTEATMIAAGAAGVFHDLTQLILTNSNTTTAAQVQIRDATAGTIRFEHVIPANSGMVVHFPVPLCQTTAANAWTIDLNAAVSTVYYTVQAIKRTA